MIKYDISSIQIGLIKHAIGWQWENKPKNKKLYAYRNRYFSCPDSDYYKDWIDLVNKKYAIIKMMNDEKNTLFMVTSKGIKLLQSIYRINIRQDLEDIVEIENND